MSPPDDAKKSTSPPPPPPPPLTPNAGERKRSLTTKISPLNIDIKNPIAWKNWHQSFNIYLKATGLAEESNERKVAILLYNMGEKSLEIFNSFNVDENIQYDVLIKKFNDYFMPKSNITFESYKFFTRRQEELETIEDYVTDLINKSKNCEFGNLTDRIIKDVFICNMHDRLNYVREKLLLEVDLTLDKAISIAKAMILSQQQAKELSNQAQSSNIYYNAVQRGGMQNRTRTTSKSDSKMNAKLNSNVHSGSSFSKYRQTSCGKCGQIHRYKCPAYGAVCHACKKKNHFESMCRNKMKVHALNTTDAELDNDLNNMLFIGHISSGSKTNWSIPITVNNVKINCVLDTGSDANVMPYNTFKLLNINVLSKCLSKVVSYSGNTIPVIGECKVLINFTLNNKAMSENVNFIIANVNSPTVLGHHTCSKLGLVQRVFTLNDNSRMLGQNVTKDDVCLSKLLENHKSVFEGLGCLPGFCHISVEESVQPKVDAPRKVPFALHDKLKQELRSMEEMDVIVKVTEPTSWNVCNGSKTQQMKMTPCRC